ncbi:putative two-component system sensor kinase [Actinoplanes missouriensis 431]|uniref:histidine kinase n=1 Tax=Actinoplanes missouriensis (strain ATCC 14538 / DSM 43046 / CBS 188.64 / JCM 3121 / NBRC 102363 / NCIMB 12654 / NRRL B-3342 / UNCC 431) TaxID=512565 RepID=I0HFI8_ACTM4|nr:histidine kinase [Actinoplanes missouriensis]BAL91775.1 putative two-component system sensor kinase [Actinoplanes missouriensis 431]
MGRRGRLFDVRDTFTRMLLLNTSGVVYLLLAPRETGVPVTGPQWALAVAAFSSGLLLHRRPPINLLVQTVLFAVALRTLDDYTINQVGTAWAIGEVALWAPSRRMLWGNVGLVAAVYLIFHRTGSLTENLVGLCINLGLPVLIGTVVRTTRELGVQAERRALSEQRAARADERSAIARELHDVVAHHVASMVLRVGVARHVLPDLEPEVDAVFDDVHRTGTAALADLRRLVAVLRDPDGVRGDAALTAIDPSALPAALDGAVETARRAGVIVEAEIDPAVGALDAVRGLAVLRLTQEALTNVAKHAGPSARASLRIVLAGDDLEWEVADDGGAPVRAAPPGGGHGLVGMRERVEVLGGVLNAGPHGPGWRVATVIPGENS